MIRPQQETDHNHGPSLLCSATFPANTGYAWDFIEGLYAKMSNRLAVHGIKTFVAYPAIEADPAPLAGSAAHAATLNTNLTSVAAAVAFWRFVRREHVKVVYLTDRPARSLQYAIMRSAGVQKIIMHDHTSGTREQARGLRRLFKNAFTLIPGITADTVVVVSDYVARRDMAITMLAPHRIVRVWNGIDLASIGGGVGTPDIREHLGLPADRLVIACACRAAPEKGVDVLFRAFRKLVVEWRDTEPPTLVYIGSGPQIDRLKSLRMEIGADRIQILGFLKGAADRMRSADVIAVPSLWQDAFPLSVLEMMARRRAIVATRVGGIPEMIIHGESGVLVEPGDVTGLCSAMRYLLTNPDVSATLGENAYRRVKSKFVLHDQIGALLRTFEDVLLPSNTRNGPLHSDRFRRQR